MTQAQELTALWDVYCTESDKEGEVVELGDGTFQLWISDGDYTPVVEGPFFYLSGYIMGRIDEKKGK